MQFRKLCENHPVLKGIVAEPMSYEETAQENDYLYRTGTNTDPYRVVGPMDSRESGSGLSPLQSAKTEEQQTYCTPLGNPLRPHQKELATWHRSMVEVEKDVAVLPSGIDHSIKASDPATWPMYYKWIRSRGNIAQFDYLCQNQIRTATPRCYIPPNSSAAGPNPTPPIPITSTTSNVGASPFTLATSHHVWLPRPIRPIPLKSMNNNCNSEHDKTKNYPKQIKWNMNTNAPLPSPRAKRPFALGERFSL
jgi:hypothetical protein